MCRGQLDRVLYALLMQALLMPWCLQGQQSHIVLEQGALVGLKVFPDSSRTAVYAFLGIPYAQPPIGQLRFAAPRPHSGWNWTLQAMSMKPICPQLTNTIYDETVDGKLARPASMAEDCLYLNVWVPEAGMRFGSLPVIVIITGEEMSYDWPRNRATGLDLASEGVVVVSVQYRTNIFGWISLGSRELSGNYGLQDQEVALKWIQHNIQHFGGNSNDVTLLGHGTGGAACAMGHVMLYAATGTPPLISKLILMSGGNMEGTLSASHQVLATSQELIQKLGCHFEKYGTQVVTCLRTKSVSDLQRAFESVYHGNATFAMGPVLATHLRDLFAPHNATQRHKAAALPITLVGITSNEGAFLRDYWLDLAREGYPAIRGYVNATVLPRIMRQFAIDSNASQIADALSWRYFGGEAAVSAVHLLNALQRLLSEAHFEAPFYRLLELMATNGTGSAAGALYAYILEAPNAMDMRGRVNLFGGASHSADLPLLLGPGLFQQIARRRFTADEDKMCRKIRTAFVNFVKTGNPTPGRIFDGWLPYTADRKFIYSLGEAIKKEPERSSVDATAFEANLPQIEKLMKDDKRNAPGGGLSRSNRNEYSNPYQLATGPTELDARRAQPNAYLTNQQDSGYALHLKRVYGFWHVMLPNMASYSGADGSYDGALSHRMRLMEASADAARYRQGFFALLGLVCLLLAILGLCVYLLRRDPLRIHAHSSRFCL